MTGSDDGGSQRRSSQNAGEERNFVPGELPSWVYLRSWNRGYGHNASMAMRTVADVERVAVPGRIRPTLVGQRLVPWVRTRIRNELRRRSVSFMHIRGRCFESVGRETEQQ